MPETTAPEPTDQELVADALADSAAYAPLVRRYQEPLARYLFRFGVRTRTDVDDILQETFLKAYRGLNGYDPALKFSSWLYRIAHNEAVSFFRKASRVPQVARDEDELEAFAEIADDHDLLAELDAKRDARALRRAIAGLDAKYRQVLVLRYLEDRTYEEISDILRKPAGTVATLLARAKKRLRAALEPSKP